ncbi:hypothetical protein ACS0TY_012199 [Phlomoides rotata]
MKHAIMNDENSASYLNEPTSRITRARAKALCSSSGLPPLHPSAMQDAKRAGLKRTASENQPGGRSAACPQPKKRAVLKDVTNINCEDLYKGCITAARGLPIKQDKKGSLSKKGKVQASKNLKVLADTRESTVDKPKKVGVKQSQKVCPVEDLTPEPTEIVDGITLAAADLSPMKPDTVKHISVMSPFNRDDNKLYMKQEKPEAEGIFNIDTRHDDPLMCTLYAADIYSSLYAKQFDRRPSPDYMEKLQKDITQGMRGILVDWLVEVSEEYKLVPDTLYLTVNLIDRYLSENYIEKQKLQLLGVTCMLIASKYEEICAPRVEEFCFITDNTYTKDEVVKMESCVLNFLNFQLSVPTPKKFLRRFIQAAQVTYKVPSVELEFLANYLAELTLTEYSFLKFLPSLTAASAVFLARWILDQSEHPWNSTLEHYTRYDTPKLRTAVLELQELQLNASGSMLNAIREKYKQPKFKRVSTLRSLKPVESLFKA